MKLKKKLLLGVAGAALIATTAGGAIAVAGSNDDDGPGVSGVEADRATAAGLEATGGGRANSVERDTEDGATWEVEVTTTDGRTVDVRLDDQYKVVVVEGDSESSDSGQ
jgi:hypothetical protein